MSIWGEKWSAYAMCKLQMFGNMLHKSTQTFKLVICRGVNWAGPGRQTRLARAGVARARPGPGPGMGFQRAGPGGRLRAWWSCQARAWHVPGTTHWANSSGPTRPGMQPTTLRAVGLGGPGEPNGSKSRWGVCKKIFATPNSYYRRLGGGFAIFFGKTSLNGYMRSFFCVFCKIKIAKNTFSSSINTWTSLLHFMQQKLFIFIFLKLYNLSILSRSFSRSLYKFSSFKFSSSTSSLYKLYKISRISDSLNELHYCIQRAVTPEID